MYGVEQALPGGADCSGFRAECICKLWRTVFQEHLMSSRTAGYEVSYADAQPGDLICYGGHVAIYMGNGQIVHASNCQRWNQGQR